MGNLAMHETLGFAAGVGNPTSGDDTAHQTLEATKTECGPMSGDNPFEGMLEELSRQRAEHRAANEAIPLSTLTGVRFGKVERWWLLNAPAEPKGYWVRPSGNRSADESHGRAWRKLQRLGLLDWMASKAEENGDITSTGKALGPYRRKDAALARGWAARLEKQAPPVATPSPSNHADLDGDAF